MSLEAGEFIRAVIIPRGFQTLLPDGIDLLARRIARKQRMSRATAFILAVGEDHPTPSDALGMLYFAEIVKIADDAIDRNATSFTDTTQLRDYILRSEIPGTNGANINELLGRCLDCYSPYKKRVITSFLDEMVTLHLDSPQRGIPGTYSYEDALAYRRVTDDPLLETFAELTGSNKARFVSIGRVWQMIEDALDWTEDTEEQTKNLFIGMATDEKEIDHLQKISGRWKRGRLFDFRVNALLGIKSSHVRRTRERYKQEILDQMPQIGGNPARLTGMAACILF